MATPLSRRLRTGLFYALRTAFRLTPMPQGTRDRLRERFLDTKGHWVPEGPKGKAPSGELPRRPYVRSDERAIGYVPYEKGELPDPLPATLVAFYLPQFHTIPENDEWWGKGFTEWRNVTRALPQFEGHYQPKLPGDLGFYDLRNVEVMHEQARLAREYGISAFCFYFYWFGGKTLLETPLRNWLNDKTIDLKFCLCWANEKWTRTWDGRGDEILIDQKHSPEDDIAFIEHVAEYMRDPRYLRVDGKPVLLVYRPGLFPETRASAERWRRWCRENGLGEIHLSYVRSFETPAADGIGFDSGVQFPPNGTMLDDITRRQRLLNPGYTGQVLAWRDLPRTLLEELEAEQGIFPGVNCGWDNEPRRSGRGRALLNVSPTGYGAWLRNAIDVAARRYPEAPPVFINAWNEWAEGAYLEPDARDGYAFLEATRQALIDIPEASAPAREAAIVVVVHAWHLNAFVEILDSLAACDRALKLEVTTVFEKEAEVTALLVERGLAFRVHAFENRGRDILPFLRVAAILVRESVDVVLKLHTKRSLHRPDGDQWRRELVDKLAGQTSWRAAADAFATAPDLGLIAPEGHVQPMGYYWGANAENVRALAQRLGLPEADIDTGKFVSGSMYWLRLRALRPLLEVGLRPSEFEAESGQVDGTMAHAIERLIWAVVRSSGYELDVAESGAGGQNASTKAYPYARRNS